MYEFNSRLQKTRTKLLDITKRNKLINYKRPSKARHLKIIDESPDFIYHRLVVEEGQFKFKYIPEPEKNQNTNELVLVKKQTKKDDSSKNLADVLEDSPADILLTAEERAKELGFDISNELPEIDFTDKDVDAKYIDDYLQTLHYPTELEKILKKIDLDARSLIQETGANMLYIILGVLEWKESNDSDVKVKSPLVNIPVTLQRGNLNRETNTYEYILKYDGDGLDTNRSLAEKLSNDFNIVLPELTSEMSFSDYIKEVSKILSFKKDWKIKQEISLDFLNFSKILMYKDLDDSKWNKKTLLSDNPILKDLFLGKETSAASYAPCEYDVDSHPIAQKIPLVMDADSSQHSAIVDVLEGKNLVIEGPPGTGKSQTISNMIATLLAERKSVLFVSEKLAALEVVYKRLSNVGLDDFCLELHSHKSQKTKVLESLKKRISGQYRKPQSLQIIKDKLEQKKKELRTYLNILHSKFGKTEQTLFQIFWMIDRYHEVAKYLKFEVKDSENKTLVDLNNTIEQLAKYQAYITAQNLDYFFWKPYSIDNLNIIDIDLFTDKIHELEKSCFVLNSSIKKLEKVINTTIDDELTELHQVNKLIKSIPADLLSKSNFSIMPKLANGGVQTLEKFISTSQSLNEYVSKNSTEIIHYSHLTHKDKQLISLFTEEIVNSISYNYIVQKQKYEQFSNSLKRFYNQDIQLLEKDTALKISTDIERIKDFLYDDITLSELKNIEEINERMSRIIEKLESLLKGLSRQSGTQFNNDIFEINTIIKAGELLNNIDNTLYICCHDLYGTAKFDTLLNSAKTEAQKVQSLLDNISLSFNVEKLLSKDLSRIRAIKKTIQEKKDSFFNFFSSEFKKAKQELEELYQNGLPHDKNLWILQLDFAIDYAEAKSNFDKNAEYISIFKELFQGVLTKWEEIEKLNGWSKQVRQDIKIISMTHMIMKGDEQFLIALRSSGEAIKNEMKYFNLYMNELQTVYSQSFFKGFFKVLDDMKIVDLQNRLVAINEQLTPYIKTITKYVIDENEKLFEIHQIFRDFNEVKSACIEGEKQVRQAISNLGKDIKDEISDIDIAKLLNFFVAQKADISQITGMIRNEYNEQLVVNNLENLIKNELDIKLEKTQTEIENINATKKIYYTIMESNLSVPIKEALIEQFEQNLSILKPIDGLYINVQTNLNELNQYSSLTDGMFPKMKKVDNYTALISTMITNIQTLSIWIDYKNIIKKLRDSELGKIVDAVEQGILPKEKITDVYYYNFYYSILRKAFVTYPQIEQHGRISQEFAIKEFKKLDLELMKLNRQEIAAKVADKEIPMGASGGSVKSLTELKLIQNETSKQKRHIPIRQLVSRAGNAIKALKPCFMMSPLSVAQYIPPSSIKFDVLIVDEASQLRPEEALGVIARANQIVIVGDPKQLPPTSFFNAITDNEENNDEETIVDESESILDTCINLYSPVRRLRWHYRSQHESLIAFSNQHFYDNDLIVFPSPTSINDDGLGIKHTYIKNSIYQNGINKLEAKVVVEHIERQMKLFPNKSLGIGTFNTQQRDLIQQLLDEKEKSNPYVASYLNKWNDSSEPFFIKNLESLQGDERDVIFISTTFGPDKLTGKVFQRFGPMTQKVGWRRLNVLITRSKQKMHVFTSLKSSDILVSESSSRGISSLKGFLQYLESGNLTYKPEIIDGKGFDSPFEESVYSVLSNAGIKSVPQVGVAGYFIDLAVVSNVSDDYVLAIECDGATYHSSKSARDRDRLKQEVLERLGWKVYRIWSTDWFKNRDNEISKLLKMVNEQLSAFAEKYKNMEITSPAHQEILVDNLSDVVKHPAIKLNLFEEIHEGKVEQIHSENDLRQPIYKQSFVSDGRIKDLLLQLRDGEIAKEFDVNSPRCILSKIMIDQFIKQKPIDMDEFRLKIPQKLRENIDREQVKYLSTIFEILDMADE